MVLALSATAAWAVHTFSDVPDDHPQADDIAYAVEQGWFQGYPDGTFKPDRALGHSPGSDGVRAGVPGRCEPCGPGDDPPGR